MRARMLLAAAAAAASLASACPAAGFPGGGPHGAVPVAVTLAQSTAARAIQGVNIRTGGGPSYPVVGTLRGGEIVGLAGCEPYWCQLADGRGWVARQYLAIGGEPGTVASIHNDGGIASPPLAPPALFTGAWTVVQTPVPPAPDVWAMTARQLYGTPKPPPPAPPFALFVAQAGDVVEGIGKGVRLAGTVQPDGGAALVTITTADGKRLAGRLAIAGGVLTAVVEDEDGTTQLWRATRTILTQ